MRRLLVLGGGLAVAAALVLGGRALWFSLLPSQAGPAPGDPGAGERTIVEVARYPAPEAHQGVAVDAEHFYAVGNAVIAKYHRWTGEKMAEWRGEDGRIVHLNSCAVVGERLACAHSNYPELPMESSLEWWDTRTLEHVDSRPVEVYDGSLTWALPRPELGADEWWLGFAHYDTRGGAPDRGTEESAIAVVGADWTLRRTFAYPPSLVERLRPYSASGAGFSAGGELWITGHDEPVVYVLELPTAPRGEPAAPDATDPRDSPGSVDGPGPPGTSPLRWTETLSAPMHGQAWVFDPTDPDLVWGIVRGDGDVVVGRVTSVADP